tara:strand:- start:315 stop:701 length:387 start_codon:yes stop_codon:yes gene_type:complete
MKVYYTPQDGWDIASPTADAIKGCARAIESFKGLVNEVNNCVRTSSIEDIKEDMNDLIELLGTYADRMDADVQYVTLGESDKERWFKYINEYGDIDTLCEKEKMSVQQAFNWVRAMQKNFVVTDLEER